MRLKAERIEFTDDAFYNTGVLRTGLRGVRVLLLVSGPRFFNPGIDLSDLIKIDEHVKSIEIYDNGAMNILLAHYEQATAAILVRPGAGGDNGQDLPVDEG